MSELISIIVPVYNTEKYLNRCIDSLINQTYKNIEILLINDGSTDNSKQICEEYATNKPNVYLYTKQNGGLSDARNFGIKKANGSYIMFIDSDDFIAATMVQALYNDLKCNNADISSVDVFKFYDDDKVFPSEHNTSETITLDREKAITSILDNTIVHNYACNKLYDIKLFENIQFPNGYVMEDLAIAYLLIETANKITYNPAQLYYYYQRRDSILHSPNPKFYKDKFYLAKRRFLYIKGKYPYCIENDRFMLSVIIECFPYVCLNEDIKAFQQLIDLINKKCLKTVRRNFKIKYMIFRFRYLKYKIFERIKNVGKSKS